MKKHNIARLNTGEFNGPCRMIMKRCPSPVLSTLSRVKIVDDTFCSASLDHIHDYNSIHQMTSKFIYEKWDDPDASFLTDTQQSLVFIKKTMTGSF
jgi:hypothetical protein